MMTIKMPNGGQVYRKRKNPRSLKAWTMAGVSARNAITVHATAMVVITAAPPQS